MTLQKYKPQLGQLKPDILFIWAMELQLLKTHQWATLLHWRPVTLLQWTWEWLYCATVNTAEDGENRPMTRAALTLALEKLFKNEIVWSICDSFFDDLIWVKLQITERPFHEVCWNYKHLEHHAHPVTKQRKRCTKWKNLLLCLYIANGINSTVWAVWNIFCSSRASFRPLTLNPHTYNKLNFPFS